MCALSLTASLLQAEVREGKLPREGFDLHYRIYGQGPPLLLLSGGPGFDPDYLEPVAVALSASSSAILVDLRGTGRSLPPKIDSTTVGLKLILSDLEDLRKSLGYERWMVLGHSAGALLGMRYAVQFPDQVSGLVLVDSGPARQALVGAMGDNMSWRLQQTQGSTENPTLQAVLPAYFFDKEKAKAFVAQFKPESFHPDTMGLLAAEEMGPGMDLRPALKHLSMPALVIAGRQDPMDPGMQYEIHLAIQKSELVLLDRCGHFAWMEQPEALYANIQTFLSAHQ